MEAQNHIGVLREDVWKHAIDRASLGLWDWDLQTNQCFYSPSWFEMLGYNADELSPDPDLWLQLTHPEDREGAIRSGERHLAGETGSIETELRLRHKDGYWVWVLDRGGVVERDAEGKPLRAIGVQTDITRLKKAEVELEQVNGRFRLALEASNTGIWQFDVGTARSYWDQRTRAIYGLEPAPEELSRQTWHDYLHPDDKERAEAAHALTPETTEAVKVRYRILRVDGVTRHVESLHRFLAVAGTAGRLIGTIRDITEECEREEQLSAAARLDSLTGLLNRAAFETELQKQIKGAPHDPFALFYIDLDYFKALNDSAGHAAGDAALKRVAQDLQNLLPTAIVARLGGDEFAVILRLSNDRPEAVAAAILGAVQQVRHSDHFGQAQLGASIGIAVIDTDQTSSADAMARADDACYFAKASGRNRWSTFAKERSFTSGLTAARLVGDLSIAKEEGRLLLFGQEIRALDQALEPSGLIEVLARLVSPSGKFISPGEFIPAAERFGMAAALDRWIIRTALRRFGSVLGGPMNVSLGFNLSAHTLSDPMLWHFIEDVAAETNAPLSNLTFEITETAAFTNVAAAERFVCAAREHGARISLDDFGVGLSSFSYLRRFAVDSIKIDGSFIENLDTSAFDRQVVASVAEIASTLGSTVVAERIERAETLEILREIGVKHGQGFLMHRPEALDRIIDRWGADLREQALQSSSPLLSKGLN